MATELGLPAERLQATDSLEAVNELYLERGWTDGLPIVPPTPERVRQMLAWTDREPLEVVAAIPPAWGEATVEKIAINAVMAGCRPEYMPVLVAAVAAMPDPDLNLYGVQATTHPCGLLLLVNGPIAKDLNINAGHGAFGPGNIANATIGRAIRLILMNIGGALPGTTDKSTQGQPCKYSYCVAENVDESPWEPFHVERGFDPLDSTVTLLGAEGPHNISDHTSHVAESVLYITAHAMNELGSNNAHARGDVFLAFGPEHAAMLGREGLSKADIQAHLFAHASIPYGVWRQAGLHGMFNVPKTVDRTKDDSPVPIVHRPEDIHIVVIGGAGRHSCFIPSFALTKTVTHGITLRDGRMARSIQEFRRSE